MSDELSLRLDLLDRQIVDADELPIGRVGDLRLQQGAAGRAPRIAALLTGSEALGDRIGGFLGRVISGVSRRLRPSDDESDPTTIPLELVAEVEDQIDLRVRLEDLPYVAPLERWLAEHVIGPLPGSGDARE